MRRGRCSSTDRKPKLPFALADQSFESCASAADAVYVRNHEMNIQKIRCIHCGNMQKVDFDEPVKTGKRTEPPHVAYLMFPCLICEHIIRVVPERPRSKTYPMARIVPVARIVPKVFPRIADVG